MGLPSSYTKEEEKKNPGKIGNDMEICRQTSVTSGGNSVMLDPNQGSKGGGMGDVKGNVNMREKGQGWRGEAVTGVIVGVPVVLLHGKEVFFSDLFLLRTFLISATYFLGTQSFVL